MMSLIKLLFVSLFTFCSVSNDLQAELPTIKTGWYPFEPYMSLEKSHGIDVLTGLDIKMLEAVLKHIQYTPEFSFVPWKQFLEDVKSGKRQMASSATKTKEREQWAYFSDPWRWEENALYVRYGSNFKFKNVADFIKKIKDTGFVLGVMDGFVYASDLINDFIHDPRYAHQIVKGKFDSDSLNNLLSGKVDGFITDRLVGATLIWRTGQNKNVEERLLGISTPIGFLISKKSTPPGFVAKVNQAIKEMRASGVHRLISQEYILPILLMQTIDRPWFGWIEVCALLAFVVSGMIIAEREKYTVVAALGIAIVPAFGGGLVRDLMVNRYPVGVLTTPRYIFIVLCSFGLVLFLINLYDIFQNRFKHVWLDKIGRSEKNLNTLIIYFDALGTSAFTVIGVLVAVMGKTEPLWLWGPFFAVMTGVGGGAIRDLLLGSRVFGSEYTYAEIPLFCGAGLSLFLSNQVEKIDPDLILFAVILTILIGFMAHMLVFYYKIPSLKIHMLEGILNKTKK
ncbi:MAG: TRIC cation channel family protein [Alphaproteobacteria bacterium]|nr:TRIC cation channel family protein [Alphaproteobacteria bacterium]